jgi:hypothetical protein
MLGFILISFAHGARASDSVGTIDSSHTLTKICQDTACTTFGNVNWKPTLNANTPGASAVTITDTSITGHLWGDQIGWINLAPAGAGISVNSATGVITGKAFANSGSWINFSPTGQGVTLVDNGSGSDFSGWAWVSGAYGGWMKFDCANGDTCIKTDWRILSKRSITPTTGGGSSGGGSSSTAPPSTPALTVPPTIPGLSPLSPQTPSQDQSLPSAEGSGVTTGVDSQGDSLSIETAQHTFDSDGDGIPDAGPNDASEGSIDARTGRKNEEDPSPSGAVRQLFPFYQSEYQIEEDCFWCVIAKKREVSQSGSKDKKSIVLIKYGFIPEEYEYGLPIPFTTDTSADTSSLFLTVLAGMGVRRLFIRVVLRFF